MEWKKLEHLSGPGGSYEISRCGTLVWIRPDGVRQEKSQRVDSSGYREAFIKIRGKRKYLKVHRLVAGAFVPNPEGLPEVNHRDFDKTNNHADNLEWSSGRDNSIHARLGGRYAKEGREYRVRNPARSGENHPGAKLTWDIVNDMRFDYDMGWATGPELAERYGLSLNYVRKILKGERWPV